MSDFLKYPRAIPDWLVTMNTGILWDFSNARASALSDKKAKSDIFHVYPLSMTSVLSRSKNMAPLIF